MFGYHSRFPVRNLRENIYECACDRPSRSGLYGYLLVTLSPSPLDLWNHRVRHVLARKIFRAKDLEVKI
jgi:hypothetical protein